VPAPSDHWHLCHKWHAKTIFGLANIISKKPYGKRLEAKEQNSNFLVNVCGKNEIDVLVHKNDSPKI
jgi:hypothetical protein